MRPALRNRGDGVIWKHKTDADLDPEWRPWFAWHPVTIGAKPGPHPEGWAWLEWMERKETFFYGGALGYVYRVPEGVQCQSRLTADELRRMYEEARVTKTCFAMTLGALAVVLLATILDIAGYISLKMAVRGREVWPTTIRLETADGFAIAESRFFVADVGEFEHPIDGRYECYELPCIVHYKHTFLSKASHF